MKIFSNPWANFSKEIESRAPITPITPTFAPEMVNAPSSKSLSSHNHKPLKPAEALEEGYGGYGCSSSSYADEITTIPRLPWQLERLVSAAATGVLNCELQGVPDPSRYTLAWAVAYLIGDYEEASKRLWTVYQVWQGSTNL